MELARRLLESGHLEAVPPHGILRATDRAWEFFRERGPYLTRPLALGEARLVKRKRDGAGRGSAGRSGRDDGAAARALAGEGGDEASAELFLLLRRKRKELADAVGVPPYVVFSDRTLREIATARPRSLEALGELFGVGERKLARYGEDFLGVVRAWRGDE
jgi:ATP-dependent DNA helicase RecQ